MSEFKFPNPSQLCAHGNPKMSCQICAEEKNKEKQEVEEKLDYSNPEHLREMLKDSPIDLAICSAREFTETTFGVNNKFKERIGATLLNNFGTKKQDFSNMVALLYFVGIAREQKKPECSYSNPEHLREMFQDSPIDLLTCGSSEFQRATFGAKSRFEKRGGYSFLKNFGTRVADIKNMVAFLNFVGITREQKKPECDYSNAEQLSELFKESTIDLTACGLVEFQEGVFGANSRFEKKNGTALLKNFGTKKVNTSNMIALLSFAGIACKQKKLECGYADLENLKEMFSYSPVDLISCSFSDFGKATFGIGSRFKERKGTTLLRNFGTKVVDFDNMIALLNFVGIAREKFDYSNLGHLKKLFDASPIDLTNCGSTEFQKATFGVDSVFEKRVGHVLLKNFGTGNADAENMIALLNSIGIVREKFDYTNPKHLKKLLENSSIDLRFCDSGEFRKTIFGADSGLEKRKGGTLLKNFGTKKDNLENMINLINLAFPEIKRVNVGAERRKSEENRIELSEYLKNLSEGKVDAKKIEQAMAFFGSSRMTDILLHFHPNFKGIPMDYINGELAEYLGEVAMQKRPLDWTTFEPCKELLSNPDFKSALLEVVKERILADCQKEQKKAQIDDIRQLIKIVLDRLGSEVLSLEDDELWEIITEAEGYYFSLLDLKKPDCILESLKHGRTFPDINQLVNIQEIKEKKKMLIADEMGLGKSASVILAKEYLGLKKALIIVPSNVEDTWEKYLSDEKDGYFQKGLAPRVLIIKSLDDLEKLNKPFDYILISQEKMKDEYVASLENSGFDMLIVDEAHKIKNIKGVRFENVERLAQKIQGEEEYLALLSGTPVPNKVSDVAMI
ncbi:MAG: SNF2-related protein, partial [Candidatus Moraniibacteriota bacterium]